MLMSKKKKKALYLRAKGLNTKLPQYLPFLPLFQPVVSAVLVCFQVTTWAL